jgi:predicted metal-dependent HD superfamily phosphohydrolase
MRHIMPKARAGGPRSQARSQASTLRFSVDMRVGRAYDAGTTPDESKPRAMTLITEPLHAELVAAYTAPDRHYHDLHHIEALLGLAGGCADEISDRDVVEAAIWFHDAIYDTRRDDNEEQSAALAAARLTGLTGCGRIARIAAMIRATAGHVMPDISDAAARHDCALFLDMDLAILGSPEADFEAYEAAIRREYDWVSEPQWRLGRRAVLTRFIERPVLYATARFRASHEAPARHNLARAMARLEE